MCRYENYTETYTEYVLGSNDYVHYCLIQVVCLNNWRRKSSLSTKHGTDEIFVPPSSTTPISWLNLSAYFISDLICQIQKDLSLY